MYFPWNNERIRNLADAKATVGQLMDLCEENYRLLIMLAPGLTHMSGSYHSMVAGQQDLHLEVLEQSPYTTLIHLTYYFPHKENGQADPDATLRVYHDAQQIEVVTIRESALPVTNNYIHPGLRDKWKANSFIGKWLSYCYLRGHFFPTS